MAAWLHKPLWLFQAANTLVFTFNIFFEHCNLFYSKSECKIHITGGIFFPYFRFTVNSGAFN